MLAEHQRLLQRLNVNGRYTWRRLSRLGKVLVCCLVAIVIIVFLVFHLSPSESSSPPTGSYIESLAYRVQNLYFCVECSTAQANCLPSCLCPEKIYNTDHNALFDPADLEGRGCYSPTRASSPMKYAYALYFSCYMAGEDADEESFKAVIASFQVAIYSVIKTGTRHPVVVVLPHDEEKDPLCKKYSKYLDWLTDTNKHFKLVRVMRKGNKEVRQEYFQRLMVFGLNYDRVIILGEDVVVLRNMDILFSVDHTPAFAFNHTIWDKDLHFTRYLGNSGLMVIDPHPKLYTLMVDFIPSVRNYYDTDLGFIVSFFKLWYQLPRAILFDKFIVAGKGSDIQEMVIDKVYALQFRGNRRPFGCPSKEADCNTEHFEDPAIWDDQDTPFRSDAMHQLWWRKYDNMVKEGYFRALPHS